MILCLVVFLQTHTSAAFTAEERLQSSGESKAGNTGYSDPEPDSPSTTLVDMQDYDLDDKVAGLDPESRFMLGSLFSWVITNGVKQVGKSQVKAFIK